MERHEELKLKIWLSEKSRGLIHTDRYDKAMHILKKELEKEYAEYLPNGGSISVKEDLPPRGDMHRTMADGD